MRQFPIARTQNGATIKVFCVAKADFVIGKPQNTFYCWNHYFSFYQSVRLQTFCTQYWLRGKNYSVDLPFKPDLIGLFKNKFINVLKICWFFLNTLYKNFNSANTSTFFFFYVERDIFQKWQKYKHVMFKYDATKKEAKCQWSSK